jgi:hypothetical protein
MNPRLDRDAAAITPPNWWLRAVSSGWQKPARTRAERELLRRSRLAGWVILGILVVTVLLIPGGLSAPATLTAIVIVDVGLAISVILNRRGLVTAAGSVLSLLISGAILYAVASTGNLSLIYLPAYDLFVLSVVVAASVISGGAAFGFAALNVSLIVLDFFVQAHAEDVKASIAQYGVAALIDRPIALQIIVAVVAFLWVRGSDEAIRRADRAEELAALEHAVAEQRRQLEVGAQQLLETHVRVANGDFAARAPVVQDNMLWQVAASLNNLLARLQKSAQADHQLRRTEDELRRLAGAIDDAQAGRRPIWPAPTGTAADLIIERITGRSRQAQPAPLMGPSPQLSPQNSRHFPAQPPFSQSPWPPQMPPSAPSMPSQMPSQMPPSAPSTQGQMPAGAPFGPGWVNSGPLAPGSPQQPNSQFSPQPNPQFSPQQPNAQYPPQPPAQRPQQGQEPAESAEPDNPWFAPPESQPPSW